MVITNVVTPPLPVPSPDEKGGMREAMHGADESCSPPTVVAERTLPTAGLPPSGWPSGEPYSQAFP